MSAIECASHNRQILQPKNYYYFYFAKSVIKTDKWLIDNDFRFNWEKIDGYEVVTNIPDNTLFLIKNFNGNYDLQFPYNRKNHWACQKIICRKEYN